VFRAYGGTICDTASFWSHINGWEAVTAIMFITVSWTVVNVARFYFMVQISRSRDTEIRKARRR
jgi:hypothetical protein